MYNAVADHVTPEQRALLKSSNFRIRPLSKAGFADLWQAFSLSWNPTAVFAAALLILTFAPLRYSNPAADHALCAVCVLAVLAPAALSFFTLVFGVAAARARSKVRWPAVTYWLWWPCWTFLLCCVAAAAGVAMGNYVWGNYSYAHARLTNLQAYQGVDPLRVGGVRLQDAGLVTFNSTAGVDRGRSACLKNGPTYCIAPIVHGGVVPAEDAPQLDVFNGDSSHKQQYDLFMVGKDCCSCPGDFRCGDWTSRGALGGLRSLSAEDKEFYQIATEQWQTSYGKMVRHPVFFTWVEDPLVATDAMATSAANIVIVSLLAFPALVTLLALGLNVVLQLMVDGGYAGPLPVPLPSECSQFLPTGFQAAGAATPAAAEPKYVVL